VEAADLEPEVGVRDSNDKQGPALVFPKSMCAAFVTGVRTGACDRRA
jgi:hypothetical protein